MMKLLTAKDFELSDFKKSSASIPFRCVQVAMKKGTIAVGDSKDPQQTPLLFNAEEWAAFITGVKNGEFDI